MRARHYIHHAVVRHADRRVTVLHSHSYSLVAHLSEIRCMLLARCRHRDGRRLQDGGCLSLHRLHLRRLELRRVLCPQRRLTLGESGCVAAGGRLARHHHRCLVRRYRRRRLPQRRLELHLVRVLTPRECGGVAD